MTKYSKQMFEFIPYDNKKYALFSPLLGGFSVFLCMLIYAAISTWMTNQSASILDLVAIFLSVMPVIILPSLLVGYGLSLATFLPTYGMRVKKEWSNAKFWFVNSLLGSIIGLVLSIVFMAQGPLFMFIMFTACFLSSMFTASIYTTMISLRYQNEKEVNEKKPSVNNVEKSESFIKE